MAERLQPVDAVTITGSMAAPDDQDILAVAAYYQQVNSPVEAAAK